MSTIHTFRVLVADDDPNDHQAMCSAITTADATVAISSVYNGMNLIDYLKSKCGHGRRKEQPPSIIVTDLYMPFAGGIQVLKQLKGLPGHSEIPVYVFSRNDDQVVRQAVLENGAAGFFRKPDAQEDLNRIVFGILKSLHPSQASVSKA